MPQIYRATSRRERRRHKRFRVWNFIVMAVGYATIVYELVRLGVYLYLLLTGNNTIELVSGPSAG